jgi:hypothetical protein
LTFLLLFSAVFGRAATKKTAYSRMQFFLCRRAVRSRTALLRVAPTRTMVRLCDPQQGGASASIALAALRLYSKPLKVHKERNLQTKKKNCKI